MLSNLTIRARLVLLGAVALAGIVLSGAIGTLQLSRFATTLESDLAEVRQGIGQMLALEAANIEFKTQVQEWKNILLRGHDPAELEKYKQGFSEREKATQAYLSKASGALKARSPQRAAEVEAVLAAHRELGQAYAAALAAFDPADPEAARKADTALRGKDRATTEALNKLVTALEREEADHLEAQIGEAKALYTASRNLMLLIVVLALVLTLAIVGLTVRQINGQMTEVQQTLDGIRASLDLTRRMPTRGRDEISLASAAVNALLDEFHTVVRRMKDGAAHVAGASDALSHSVGQLSAAVAQQNDATSSMAASVEEMAVSVTHMAESSGTAQGISQKSQQLAGHGGEVIERTVTEMERMAETVRRTSTTMEDLGRRSEEIGSIAGVIKEIADQTNLLALNAAIEAARAGEQGRGFAVVADEVRKLAERTAKATTQIAGVIDAVQTDTRRAVDDMHAVVAQVGETADTARQAGEAIVSIRQGSTEVVGVTNDISTALKEQSTASEVIAKQVERIAAMSEENGATLGEVNAASTEMKQLAADMHRSVDRFRV